MRCPCCFQPAPRRRSVGTDRFLPCWCWWWRGMRCRLSAAPQAPHEQPQQEAEPCLRVSECHHRDALRCVFSSLWSFLCMHLHLQYIETWHAWICFVGLLLCVVAASNHFEKTWVPPTQKLPLAPLHPHSPYIPLSPIISWQLWHDLAISPCPHPEEVTFHSMEGWPLFFRRVPELRISEVWSSSSGAGLKDIKKHEREALWSLPNLLWLRHSQGTRTFGEIRGIYWVIGRSERYTESYS